MLIIAAVDGLRSLVSRRPHACLTNSALVAWLGLALWGAHAFNPPWLGRPPNPQEHHKRLAAHMISIGDLESARRQLRAAVAEEAQGTPPPAELDRRASELLTKKVAEPKAAEVARERAGELQPSPLKARATLPPPVDYDRVVPRFGLQQLNEMRAGYLRYHAGSNIDTDVRFPDIWSVLRYLPKAVFNAAFTPNPWTRFQAGGTMGSTRDFSMAEVGLVALLVATATFGVVRALPVFPNLVASIVVYSLILAAVLGLVVPTVGILFRLRLGFLMPLCILAGGVAMTTRK